ncbi:MerR family transcriptional regulator [Paenibacillus sp. HJGM_3]|uniref:MerR family transcriptional regulator n=1 Tax=Paenibacillus sp. HJGM_3 TaxID=3379816 RepID=UPI00385CEF6A
MKINAFSYRTGLSPSALRFYDRKGLLSPTRMSNGYRLYSEDQIGTALQIHSLRQADVPLEDI